MTPFWIALQFLSTFPVSLKQMPTAVQNAQSLLFYPLCQRQFKTDPFYLKNSKVKLTPLMIY